MLERKTAGPRNARATLRKSSPRSLAGLRGPLLVLGVMGLLACNPTGNGDLACGTLDTTEMGQLEACASVEECPAADICVGGFCTGAACSAGTCELSGTAFICATEPGDSGGDAGGPLDAASDSRADATGDSNRDGSRADALPPSDTSTDAAAGH